MLIRNIPGSVEVICGSMFSGKTEELLRRLRRAQYARQKIQVFKPSIDSRYSENHVTSHDSTQLPSCNIKEAGEILAKAEANTRIVGIDEAQFLDDEIVNVAQQLAYRGIRVLIAGLDMDFRGKPFGPMPELLAIAESVTKLSAVCVVCGAPATRTQRIADPLKNSSDEEQVVVGASERYEPRCRFCHEPQSVDESRHYFGPQSQTSESSRDVSRPFQN